VEGAELAASDEAVAPLNAEGESTGEAPREGGGEGRRRGGRGRRERRDENGAMPAAGEQPSAEVAQDAPRHVQQAWADSDAQATMPALSADPTHATEVAAMSEVTRAESHAEAPDAVQTRDTTAEAPAAPAPAAAAPVTAAAPVSPAMPAAAPAPAVRPFVLPLETLQSVAQSAGLEWVGSDAEKVRAVQAAMAAEPAPVHVPRERKPMERVDEGPLVLVETRKDLSQFKLPFETAPGSRPGA
jgi:ribonuclease E